MSCMCDATTPVYCEGQISTALKPCGHCGGLAEVKVCSTGEHSKRPQLREKV